MDRERLDQLVIIYKTLQDYLVPTSLALGLYTLVHLPLQAEQMDKVFTYIKDNLLQAITPFKIEYPIDGSRPHHMCMYCNHFFEINYDTSQNQYYYTHSPSPVHNCWAANLTPLLKIGIR